MKNMTWQKIAEFVGVFGILIGLFMVVVEIRQANEIARTQVIMDLASQYNGFNSARFQDPLVASLSLKMISPGDFSISDEEASMMAGAAWHFANILWSAQIAYESDIISREDLLVYQSHMSWMLDNMPGLTPEFIAMYRSNIYMKQALVFEPLRQRVEQSVD